jgi:hypothetical protein
MGIYNSLPRGSQVKLWGGYSTKKVGDNVSSFGLPKYVVLLREGGYVIVEDGKITKIVENYGRKYYYPEDFPGISCFDKWGNDAYSITDLMGTGLFGENYYWKASENTLPDVGQRSTVADL